MTEAERQELLVALDRATRSDLSHGFVTALLTAGGAGAFLFLYAVAEVFPWH